MYTTINIQYTKCYKIYVSTYYNINHIKRTFLYWKIKCLILDQNGYKIRGILYVPTTNFTLQKDSFCALSFGMYANLLGIVLSLWIPENIPIYTCLDWSQPRILDLCAEENHYLKFQFLGI